MLCNSSMLQNVGTVSVNIFIEITNMYTFACLPQCIVTIHQPLLAMGLQGFWYYASGRYVSLLSYNGNAKRAGLVRDLNPGPLAPKARIIPLDQRACAASLAF